MADVWIMQFHGGGCNGQDTFGKADEPPHDSVACGGTVYTVYRVEDLAYLALLPSARPPGVYQPPSTAPEPLHDGDVLAAWHSLSNAVSKVVPGAVNRTRSLRARIRAAGTR